MKTFFLIGAGRFLITIVGSFFSYGLCLATVLGVPGSMAGATSAQRQMVEGATMMALYGVLGGVPACALLALIAFVFHWNRTGWWLTALAGAWGLIALLLRASVLE